MNKMKLEICTGTTSYLLGAADLLDVLENLPDSLKDKGLRERHRLPGFLQQRSKAAFYQNQRYCHGGNDLRQTYRHS